MSNQDPLSTTKQLCIPDWPMYNRNKVVWLDEVEEKVVNKSSKGKQSSKSQKKGADKKQQ